MEFPGAWRSNASNLSAGGDRIVHLKTRGVLQMHNQRRARWRCGGGALRRMATACVSASRSRSVCTMRDLPTPVWPRAARAALPRPPRALPASATERPLGRGRRTQSMPARAQTVRSDRSRNTRHGTGWRCSSPIAKFVQIERAPISWRVRLEITT
jgi:hypothetical protein